MSVFIWVLPLFFPAALIQLVAVPEETKNPAGRCPPSNSDPFSDAEFAKNYATVSSKKRAATPNRRFEFEKRSELFIRVHNEPLSVIAMRVSNEDRSPVAIQG
jgi:hypothetical protein